MEGKVTDFKTVSKLTRLDLIWFDSCPDFGAHQGKAGWTRGSRAWRGGGTCSSPASRMRLKLGTWLWQWNRKPVGGCSGSRGIYWLWKGVILFKLTIELQLQKKKNKKEAPLENVFLLLPKAEPAKWSELERGGRNSLLLKFPAILRVERGGGICVLQPCKGRFPSTTILGEGRSSRGSFLHLSVGFCLRFCWGCTGAVSGTRVY